MDQQQAPADSMPDDVAQNPIWWQLVRPLLIVGLALGVLDLAGSLLLAGNHYENIAVLRKTGGPLLTPQILISLLLAFAPPVALILGAAKCLRRRWNWRLLLLIYCWVQLGLTLWETGEGLYSRFQANGGVALLLFYSTRSYIVQMVFPALLLWTLTRQVVKDQFRLRVAAFEVTHPPSP